MKLINIEKCLRTVATYDSGIPGVEFVVTYEDHILKNVRVTGRGPGFGGSVPWFMNPQFWEDIKTVHPWQLEIDMHDYRIDPEEVFLKGLDPTTFAWHCHGDKCFYDAKGERILSAPIQKF